MAALKNDKRFGFCFKIILSLINGSSSEFPHGPKLDFNQFNQKQNV